VGTTVTPTNFAARVLVANISGQFTSLSDGTKLKNNVAYTYFVVATLAPLPDCVGSCGNLQSGVSNFATVVY
jgi:2-methylaconitate cis-trans-isomerase PrpF